MIYGCSLERCVATLPVASSGIAPHKKTLNSVAWLFRGGSMGKYQFTLQWFARFFGNKMEYYRIQFLLFLSVIFGHYLQLVINTPVFFIIIIRMTQGETLSSICNHAWNNSSLVTQKGRTNPFCMVCYQCFVLISGELCADLSLSKRPRMCESLRNSAYGWWLWVPCSCLPWRVVRWFDSCASQLCNHRSPGFRRNAFWLHQLISLTGRCFYRCVPTLRPIGFYRNCLQNNWCLYMKHKF